MTDNSPPGSLAATGSSDDRARGSAVAEFKRHFGHSPSHLARAPGRVNLIGEHTDYNDGFVLPMGLDRSVWLALRPRADSTVRLLAADLAAEGSYELEELATASAPADQDDQSSSWLDYPRGVSWSLLQDGYELSGFDGVISSDVPRGAGLSSSAALELAVAAAHLLALGEDSSTAEGWNVRRIARAMQRTENDWIGVSSGIMDQLIGAAAVAGHATLIDCRDLGLTHVPLPAGIKVAVLDTGTRRGLVGSEYNDRRASCERVAQALGVAALRDADLATLERLKALDAVDKRRARHVIEENQRTVEASAALSSGDVQRTGELMRLSHASLRDLYQVSSPALDAMVEAAESAPGCLGARMTGAGFGGCAVALVREEEATLFTEVTTEAYVAATGGEAAVYLSAAGAGASTIKLLSGD